MGELVYLRAALVAVSRARAFDLESTGALTSCRFTPACRGAWGTSIFKKRNRYGNFI
jgi:hypothetical protein